MNPDRWQQVKAIFNRAVETDPAVRTRFLRESCEGDTELQREVAALLASDERADSLLENPFAGVRAMVAAAARVPDPMIGRAIGNYIITHELAHGGMGIVYRARHLTLPRDAVVKCIRPAALDFSEA